MPYSCSLFIIISFRIRIPRKKRERWAFRYIKTILSLPPPGVRGAFGLSVKLLVVLIVNVSNLNEWNEGKGKSLL